MKRLELYNLIDNNLKLISSMSPNDRAKVAEIVKNTVDEFLNVDSSEFENEDLSKIFEMSKKLATLGAISDCNNLISGGHTTLPNNGYSQVQFSLMKMRSHLRIDTNS
jgi:hypothetical protein